MAANTGTTLPGGYRNSLGGPADEWYAQTNGTAYASLAEACATVPQAFRRNRTVIVVDQEYWWLESDLSDNGLVLKTAASSGGTPGTGTGGSVTYKKFTFLVTTAGAQSIPLPTGAAGVFAQARTEYDVLRPFDVDHYSFTSTRLLIKEEAELAVGEEVQVIYSLGGGAGDTGGPVRNTNNVPQSVKDAVRAQGHTWLYGDLTAYASSDLQAAALDGVQEPDFFDDFEMNSAVDAYRYTYCAQNGGQTVGWTRIYKLQ